MEKGMQGFGYQKRNKKILILAVVFLLAAALFFSYQVVVLFGGEGPMPSPSDSMDTEILNVKNALDGISTEFDNIARLI